VFLACLRNIERHRPVFLALGAIILVGGLARLLSAIELGWPARAPLRAGDGVVSCR
jgi:hypothetical protein